MVKNVSTENKISPEVQRLIGEFPKLFNRKKRVKNHESKIEIKEYAKTSQPKGPRVPIQFQDQVDK